MKFNKLLLIWVIVGMFLSSCTKNEVELDITVKIDTKDIIAGQKAVFTITGDAEFVTFYDGRDSATSYANYPLSKGRSVQIGEISQVYTKHGSANATFIASSYGDWGEESTTQQFDFIIDVKDNRTGVSSFMIKKVGLGGVEYYGIINEDNGTISVITPAGTDVSNMQTTLIAESVDAKIWYGSAIIGDNYKIDYSGDNVILTIEAPDGTKQDWEVIVTNN